MGVYRTRRARITVAVILVVTHHPPCLPAVIIIAERVRWKRAIGIAGNEKHTHEIVTITIAIHPVSGDGTGRRQAVRGVITIAAEPVFADPWLAGNADHLSEVYYHKQQQHQHQQHPHSVSQNGPQCVHGV
uniref:Putative secreted protein n=1 Tax=Anopheles marajoara TaxID=58244 RepID=A0A2M4C7Y4_9DIPT